MRTLPLLMLLVACDAGSSKPSDGQAAKMRNCPVSVAGAQVVLDDVAGGVQFEVRAASPEGAAEIRRRAREVVDRTTGGPRKGNGKSGGFMRRCPVVTQDTRIAVVEIDGGATLTVTPISWAYTRELRAETRARFAKLQAEP